MKKILILILLLFLVGCSDNIKKEIEKKENKIMAKTDNYQGSLTVDNSIIDFKSLGQLGGEKVRKLIYKNFDNIVIEIGSTNFLEGIENYKGKELLIHIGYDVWEKNSIEILKKLKDLDLNSLSIDIRENYGNNGEENVDKLILKKDEAILFSKIKAKDKDLSLTMGRKGIGNIVCSNEVLKILGIKKEDCFFIQIKDGKAL